MTAVWYKEGDKNPLYRARELFSQVPCVQVRKLAVKGPAAGGMSVRNA